MVDIKTGYVMQDWLRWLENRAVSNMTDIGSALSGVAQARAEAAAAQTTASAAQQQAADVGSGALAFSLSLNELFVYEFRIGAGSVVSSTITGTPTGGTGPYTYAWTKDSGDTLTLSAALAASTTFSSTLTDDETKSAVYRLTVTDSLLATASATIGVTLASLLS